MARQGPGKKERGEKKKREMVNYLKHFWQINNYNENIIKLKMIKNILNYEITYKFIYIYKGRQSTQLHYLSESTDTAGQILLHYK